MFLLSHLPSITTDFVPGITKPREHRDKPDPVLDLVGTLGSGRSEIRWAHCALGAQRRQMRPEATVGWGFHNRKVVWWLGFGAFTAVAQV